MAELEKLMGVSADDIEKIMGVETGDIETIMGVEVPSGPAWQGARGILWGRTENGGVGDNTILYRTIGAASGNTADFGDMNAAGKYGASISSGTRGIHAGGHYLHSSGNWYGSNNIEYITIGSTGNGTDFGNLNDTAYGQGASTNGILGTVFGGYRGAPLNECFSITIASAGDSTDVGNLTEARSSLAGVCSVTMSIQCGGYKGGSPSRSNVIDYTSWGSLGDSSDFGDLTVIGNRETGGEDSSRGILFGLYQSDAGAPNTRDTIDYFNTSSTGNASDFGNTLSLAYHSSWGSNLGGTYGGGAMCNGVRMDVAGGNTQGSSGYAETAKIQYITIQTTGDATDYGDDVDDWDGDGASYTVSGCSGN